jgi:SWI/SNF-related matrix-associated actin-dependent regulator 1 of chromatin subfamily A
VKTPWHFQEQGYRTIRHYHGVALLGDDMGLGKTLQALLWLTRAPAANPALIICPAHLKWHWEEEARSMGYRTQVISGLRPQNGTRPDDLLPHGCQALICNYEMLRGWQPLLSRVAFKTAILDEAHYVRNRAAKRTKAAAAIVRRVSHRVAITGTPMLSRPSELYNVIHMLWPNEFPSRFAYLQRYCAPVRKPWGWDYKGASHLAELHGRLRRCGLIRRRKADVLADLPAKLRTVVPLDVQLDEYREAETNFLAWLRKQSIERANKAATATQMARIGYLRRLAAVIKLPLVMDWITDYLSTTDEKLVVFGVHRAVLRSLHKQFSTHGVLLDGSTPMGHRQRMVQQFQKDNKTRLLFGQLLVAGVGYTLTAATQAVKVELDWVPANHTQAEDRLHRLTQTGQVQITYLVSRGTIEERLCRILQDKQAIVNQAIDGCADTTDMDVYNELVKGLLQDKGMSP